MPEFTIKDSGKRQDYESGMRRDVNTGKPKYNLIDRDFLKRWAIHMAKGAEKYGEENWRLANSLEEYERFRESAFRHFMQWMNGETDEDHAVAVAFNIAAAEYVKQKMENKPEDKRCPDCGCYSTRGNVHFYKCRRLTDAPPPTP